MEDNAQTDLENDDIQNEDDVLHIDNSCTSMHLKSLKGAVSSSKISNDMQIDMEEVPKEKISNSSCDVILPSRAQGDLACNNGLSVWQAEQLGSTSDSESGNMPMRLAKFANVSLLNCRVSNTSNGPINVKLSRTANNYNVQDNINSVPADKMCKSLMFNKNDITTTKKAADEDLQCDTLNNNVFWESANSNELSSNCSACCEPDGMGEISFTLCEQNLRPDLEPCDNSLPEKTDKEKISSKSGADIVRTIIVHIFCD